MRGAIAQRADSTLAGFNPDQRDAVRTIFTRLVQVARPEEGAEDTRRRINLEELAPQTATLAQQLADARLLVTGRDPDSGEETIEVAHEALIRGWQQLREWLNSDREFLLWRQRLRTLADIWDGSGRSEGALLRDTLLREAQVRSRGRTDDLNALELAFIRESEVAAERAEQAREAARQRELERERALVQSERAGRRRGPFGGAAALACDVACRGVGDFACGSDHGGYCLAAGTGKHGTGAATTGSVGRGAPAGGSQGPEGEVRCPGRRSRSSGKRPRQIQA